MTEKEAMRAIDLFRKEVRKALKEGPHVMGEWKFKYLVELLAEYAYEQKGIKPALKYSDDPQLILPLVYLGED